MNKTLIILISITAIFLTAYWLYWQGELSIERASGKFTAVGFENTNLNCDKNSLEFFIENNLREKIDYQVDFFSNKKNISKEIIPVNPSEKKKIKIQTELIKEVCQKENYPLKFQISVKKNNETEIIYKIINQ